MAPGQALPPARLVIDAAYGTGLQRRVPPAVSRGLAGPCRRYPLGPLRLDGRSARRRRRHRGGRNRHVRLLQARPSSRLGPALAGDIEVADIGLGKLAGAARKVLVGRATAMSAALVPARAREAHKWQTAVQVVAGSPGMTGAPWLASRAALRAGAGYVRLSMPGVDPSVLPPGELVHLPVPASGWHARCSRPFPGQGAGSGPGLGPVAARQRA